MLWDPTVCGRWALSKSPLLLLHYYCHRDAQLKRYCFYSNPENACVKVPHHSCTNAVSQDFSEPEFFFREGTHAYIHRSHLTPKPCSKPHTQNQKWTSKADHELSRGFPASNHLSKLHSREPWDHPLGTPSANTAHQSVQIESLWNRNYRQRGWAEVEPSFSSHLEHTS